MKDRLTDRPLPLQTEMEIMAAEDAYETVQKQYEDRLEKSDTLLIVQ